MRTVTLSVLIALLLPACGKPEGEPAGRADIATADPAAAEPTRVDACELVTQADATGLFGEPAARGTGVPVTDPSMLGECLWEHDSEIGSHLLQARVWGSPQYYSAPTDEFTKPLDLGDKAYIRVHSGGGVDIAWIQGGRVYEVSYSTVGGARMARAADRANAVTQLARQVSGKI